MAAPATHTRSLEGLREIALPEPVSYMPQAIGWWLLLAVVLLVLGWWAYRRYRHWLANRYRTDALERIDAVGRRLGSEETRAAALAEIAALVKRAALHSFPRDSVAGLTGEGWLAFLKETCPSADLSDGPGRLLIRVAYESPESLAQVTDSDAEGLLTLARTWVRDHRAPRRKEPGSRV